MTFKDFFAWCNEKVCAGAEFWNLREVTVVVDIVEDVRKRLPWRREKYWKKRYESRVMQQIVIPINKRIEESLRKGPNK